MVRIKKDLNELGEGLRNELLENSEIGSKKREKVKLKNSKFFPETVNIVTKNEFLDDKKDMLFDIEFGDEGTTVVTPMYGGSCSGYLHMPLSH